MCGIAGFSNNTHTPLRFPEDMLRHRGPDDDDIFSDDFISFFHWRLSIIDLSHRAHQPFRYRDLVIIYNGELYNFREVRVTLQKSGYGFNTESDTEVIIKAFDFWGPGCVTHFRGMFAFAIYDEAKKEVYLFRDRLGVKPLYYSLLNGLAFGSEVKVFKYIGHSFSIDPIALHQYFRWGYVPGERTIYEGIHKLRPGCYMKYANGTVVIRSYWQIPIPDESELESEEETVQKMEEILSGAFEYRMVSDVPVGIFLSGGIDSSLLTTLLQRTSDKPINTFTIGFDDGRFSEAPFARELASRLGTDHHEFILNVSRGRDLFQNFYSVYDEPFSDTSGIPTALIASIARENGIKVVLSADGADEFFGGYPRYLQSFRWLIGHSSLLPQRIRTKVAGAFDVLLPPVRRARIASYNFQHRLEMSQELFVAENSLEFYESLIANQANREISQLTGFTFNPKALLELPELVNPVSARMYWDASFYLPDDLLVKVDRATMHYGVEAREPFLDHHIIEFAQRLPLKMKIRGNTTKYILRKILSKYHPEKLFDRPKQGFSIPMFTWFTKELDDLFDEYLNAGRVDSTGVLNSRAVLQEKRKYELYKSRGKDYNIEKMWRLLSFMMWHDKWMK